MRKASNTLVGRSKGMDRAELDCDVEGAGGLCGLDKVCKSCCPQRTE